MNLLFEPSDQNVAAILHRLVNSLERGYPNRVVAYYLRGSHADGSANELSDVDFVVVVKDMNDTFAVSRSIGFTSPAWPVVETVTLAISQLNDQSLTDLLVTLKWGSELLYGRDVRNDIVPQWRDYTRAVIRACRSGIAMLRDSITVPEPLNYPEPSGEFFGYEATRSGGHKAVRKLKWYRVGTSEGTKELASVVARSATGLIAVQVRQFVSRRAQVIAVYSHDISDEWTDFIRDVSVSCRETWGYRVPEQPADREHLRGLCQRMLDFEKHCLGRFSGW